MGLAAHQMLVPLKSSLCTRIINFNKNCKKKLDFADRGCKLAANLHGTNKRAGPTLFYLFGLGHVFSPQAAPFTFFIFLQLHYKTKPHILTANREEFVKRTPDGEV
jgi:hypothetical protein